MKYLETKIKLEEAMELDEPMKKVTELYESFEDSYSHVAKRKRDCNERINIYFKFLDYIQRNKNEKRIII